MKGVARAEDYQLRTEALWRVLWRSIEEEEEKKKTILYT